MIVARNSGSEGRPTSSAAAEQRHERESLLCGDREIMVAGEHVLVASALFGVNGRATHHLDPPVGHVDAMHLAYFPTEQRRDVGCPAFHQVIEAVQPTRERLAAPGPLIDCRRHVIHSA